MTSDISTIATIELIEELQCRGYTVTVTFPAWPLQPPTEKNFANSTTHPVLPEILNGLRTLGGKEKFFVITNDHDKLTINRVEAGIVDSIPISVLFDLVKGLEENFGNRPFGLSNNVQKLWRGEEGLGLGTILFDLTGDIRIAQASSQLASIFTELGLFSWDGRSRSMTFTLNENQIPSSPSDLAFRLEQLASDIGDGKIGVNF